MYFLLLLFLACSALSAHAQTWTMHGSTVNLDNNGWSQNPSMAVDTNGDIWIATAQERKPDLFLTDGTYSSKISVSKYNGTTTSTIGNPIGRTTTDGSTYAVSWAPSIATIGTTAYVAHYEANGNGADGSNESSCFVHQWNGSAWTLLSGTRSNGSVSSGDGTIECSSPVLANVGGTLYLAVLEVNNSGSSSWNHQISVFHWTGSAWAQDGSSFLNNSTIAGVRITSLALTSINDVPYVAWHEYRRTGTSPSLYSNSTGDHVVRVRKLSGGSWVTEGSDFDFAGIANNVAIVGVGTTPYVAWQERTLRGNNRLYLKAWNGSTWATVGSPTTLNSNQTTGWVGAPSLTTDGTDVWLSWAENDEGAHSKIYTRKLTVASSTWGSIETVSVDASTTSTSSVASAVKSGTPYVAFRSVHVSSATSHVYLFGRNGTGGGSPPSLSAWGSNGSAPSPSVGSWVTLTPGGVIGSGGAGINAEGFSVFRCLPYMGKCVVFEKYHDIPSGASGESQTAMLAYTYATNRWDLFDVTEAGWSEHLPGSGHDEGAMARINKTMLLYQGNLTLNQGTNMQHTYIYDAKARTGYRVMPNAESPHTADVNCATDDIRNEVFCFGDNVTTGYLYSASQQTWIAKATGPDRGWPCMVYAPPPVDRYILFGGRDGGSVDSNETWVYNRNDNTWTQRTPSSPPGARYSPMCSWDAIAKVMLMTAGGSNETWQYDPLTGAQGTWTQLANAPSGVTALGRGAWLDYLPEQNVHILIGDTDLNPVYIFRVSSTAVPSIPVGDLMHDGPATPEQLALLVPVLDATLTQATTATMRYKVTGAGAWTTGHNLLRIRPDHSSTDGNEFVGIIDAFAWTITGLTPGTSYDVEVTITEGANEVVRTATFVTRALPAAAGTANKTISAGASTATIQTALNGLVPGDVLEFASSTFTLTAELAVGVSGTAASPIYIRGASRSGTKLARSTGAIWKINAANHIIFENMAIEGSNVDSGTAFSSRGVEFSSSNYYQTNITVRNMTIDKVDVGVVASGEIQGALVYNNTMDGNNSWTQDFYAHGGSGAPGAGDGTPDVDQNLFWNDDGIRLPGYGNAAWQNSLRDFGDALAVCSHSGETASAECRGIHFYRNDIKMTGDDAIEADFAMRAVTSYDNRWHNSMTCISLDPIYGGPFLSFRNVCINVGRSPYKFNNTNSGHFIWNHTVVRANLTSGYGWLQPSNGAQKTWGYQNNLFFHEATPDKVMAMESTGNDPIDWSHNSWYPDGEIRWTNSGSNYANLAAAFANIPATTSIFSGYTKRHQNDAISEANPFVTDIVFSGDYHTEVTTYYTPTLAGSTVPKNAGLAIVGVTDGFTGAAPDQGAIIAGRSVPTWGDQALSAGPGGSATAGKVGLGGGARLQ